MGPCEREGNHVTTGTDSWIKEHILLLIFLPMIGIWHKIDLLLLILWVIDHN